MDNFTKDDLNTLMSYQDQLCISIYMPTIVKGKETRQNPVRFRNILRSAENSLSALDLHEESEKIIESAGAAVQSEINFWQHQSDGLAVFITDNAYYYYRLPVSFNELVVVSDRFHLKPLYPLCIHDDRYYILALSQNDVRFFKAGKHHIQSIELTDVPKSLSESLASRESEKELQFRTVGGDSQDQTAIYHGTGAGDRDKVREILHFFRDIDKGVSGYLSEETSPLVLAGVEYLHAIYEKANNYNFITENGLHGNPEKLSPEELRAKTYSLVKPVLESSRKKAIERYRELSAQQNDLVSDDILVILKAAYEGKVDLLFVKIGVQIWGRFEPKSGILTTHRNQQPGDNDLLDLATAYTVMNNGSVFTTSGEDSQITSDLAAIFRY